MIDFSLACEDVVWSSGGADEMLNEKCIFKP